MRSGKHDLMWQQLLSKARTQGQPLQVQLCTVLVTAILDGRLPAGTRLPSARDLASLCGISRNTAVLVYQRLVAEEYLESRLRDGFFVCAAIKPTETVTQPPARLEQAPDWSRHLPPPPDNVQWADRPPVWREVRYPFIYGQFDSRLFPLSQWRQCSRQALEIKAVDRWWQEGEDINSTQLIDQLIRRVLPRRGIAATHDQVLLTLGRQQSFYLLARLFARQGQCVGVEDPGYADARNVFGHDGAQVVALPIDAEGVTLSPALERCHAIYCTPCYQCPTGVTMSKARRTALLAHAALHDQIIFEDDDDPETEYNGQGLPALKAVDHGDRVIYLSSLSKLLSPGLCIGYIVAPALVIARLRALQRLMIRQIPGNNQITAALFIQQGHYDRLLQKNREHLGRCAAIIIQALRQALPEAPFTAPSGGATLWLPLPYCHDPYELYKEALASGVLIDPATLFFANPAAQRQQYLRLGFGAISPERIAPGIRELANILAAHARRWQP